MNKTYSALRKVVVFIVGASVLIAGVILIPLPGPGLLVIVAGLVILSLEFDWAKRYLDLARKKLDQLRQKAKRKSKKDK